MSISVLSEAFYRRSCFCLMLPYLIGWCSGHHLSAQRQLLRDRQLPGEGLQVLHLQEELQVRSAGSFLILTLRVTNREIERDGPCWLLKLKGVTFWLVRWNRRAGTKYFCSALAGLVSPVQNIIFLAIYLFTLLVLLIAQQPGQGAVLGRPSLCLRLRIRIRNMYSSSLWTRSASTCPDSDFVWLTTCSQLNIGNSVQPVFDKYNVFSTFYNLLLIISYLW